MGSLTGMEKFSHLEDKIYLTIEFAKKMREEKERLERETNSLEDKIERLMSERDAIQLKIEAMLDAITVIEPEVAEVLHR
jgi:predicted  nucleic acid-binding Zn-ribbon protein